MQIFKNISIDFVSKQAKALMFSTLFVVAGIVMLYTVGGPQMGIDFTGGARVILKFDQDVAVSVVRDVMKSNNFTNAEVKTFGLNTISVSVQTENDADNERLVNQMNDIISSQVSPGKLVEPPSVQKVSGKMSQELISNSIAAIVIALVMISLYIIVRFSTSNILAGVIGLILDGILYSFVWKGLTGFFIPIFTFYPIWKAGFAFGALVAVFHDVMIALSLLEIFNVEMSGPVIAALLTIIGYSLNDTIVVFDRIRENLTNLKAIEFTEEAFKENINKSINTTLNRTVITSLTTFFVVLVLSLLGGESLYPFAITLCFGVVVGTYSSIFIAAPIMMKRYVAEMEEKKAKELARQEELNPHDPDNQGIVL